MEMTVQEIKQRVAADQRSVPVYNERPRAPEGRAASSGLPGPLGNISGVDLGAIDAGQLALGLGWFGIALGLAEVAAPQWVAQVAGVEASRDSRALISAFGVREIANGLAILAQPDNPLWVQPALLATRSISPRWASRSAGPRTTRGRSASPWRWWPASQPSTCCAASATSHRARPRYAGAAASESPRWQRAVR